MQKKNKLIAPKRVTGPTDKTSRVKHKLRPSPSWQLQTIKDKIELQLPKFLASNENDSKKNQSRTLILK